MPIYEYYCKACNTIFNFYSKTFTVKKQPACPRCRGSLQKHVSAFSLGQGQKGPEDLPMSRRQVEDGLKRLEAFGQKDPEEAARLRSKFGKMTGVNFEESKKKPSASVHDSNADGYKAQPVDKTLSDEHEAPPEHDDHLYEL